MRKPLVPAFFVFLLFIFSGCVTAPIEEQLPKTHRGLPGAYYKVKKGQTLWRIAKMHNLDIDELVAVNHIADTSHITVGQTLFIPYGQARKATAGNAGEEDFSWPLKGGRVIADYGQTIDSVVNRGINIAASGNSDILASRSGRVVFYSPDFANYGKAVIIDHGDGYLTFYGRNSQVFIKPGDLVTKGMAIAKVGSAGRDKAKYLHFEIRKGYLPQNPGFYLS